ncbi:alpha/beta-hydrolase [Conidiobolus coronatus NRRL 28638]|uniref:Alpha/beta-hydrolase n=1 Tax=Conidiobolus coronatus (strain ATCC 28846 / CBS 209.66 / NRRL 28638) TaxID=796925 RepID=A0A137P535_CONC2|nr:alpha/beta-hydrolase [Conidiobolus coronatus NRRL 28638]|eukprot:KXN70059.1 alpha/beta-hydrolase [Conidiobolus coronatus NRRL 28638]
MIINKLKDNEYKVQIANKSKLNLIGNLIINSRNSTFNRRLLIICHGLLDTKESPVIDYIQNAIFTYENSSFDILKFDFAGNGESEGMTTYSDYPGQVEDLKDWIDAFQNKTIELPSSKGEDSYRFTVDVVSGHSKGGTVVMLYASKYPEIENIINLSGRCKLQECSLHRFKKEQLKQLEEVGKFKWKQMASSVTPEHIRDVYVLASDFDWRQKFDYECYKAILNNPNRLVHTIHGTKDSVVPYEDAIMFDQLVKPSHILHSIKDAGHVFNSEAEQLELKSCLHKCLDNLKHSVKL